MQPEPDATASPADTTQEAKQVEPESLRLVRIEVGRTTQESMPATAPTGAFIDEDTITTLLAADVLVHDAIARLRTGGLVDQVTIADLRDAAAAAQANIEKLELDGTIDRAEIANLKQALVTARRIGAAIGIIMASKKVTEEQAFTLLCENSQRSNRKLRDVADTVLMTGECDVKQKYRGPAHQ